MYTGPDPNGSKSTLFKVDPALGKGIEVEPDPGRGAHEKLYSNMSIKCSFDHSFDRQQLKITGKSLFVNCFI